MLRIRIALVFAATVFAVVASRGQPGFQPFGQPPTPTPLSVTILSGIDDPVVVDELKLKDEQVKALVERRKELWEEQYTTAPKKFNESVKARNEATEALLKKTLTAEQHKRAIQLAAQSVLATRRFGQPDAEVTFNLARLTSANYQRSPELASVFKLTDDQKKQLETEPKGGKGGFGRSVTMTKEQSDAAKEFLGPVAKRWQAKFDPRIAQAPAQPEQFYLVEAKDVRTDIGLTEAESKVFTTLADKWQKLTTDRRTELSPKEADAQAKVLKEETEKALATLKPAHVARLKQIEFQTNGGLVGGPGGRPTRDMHIESVYARQNVKQELEITDDQVKEFAAIRQAFETDATAILSAATAFDATDKKLNDLVAARRAKAEKVLTDKQVTKWTAMVGKPFTGNIGGGGFNPNPQNLDAMRTAWFGKHSFAEFNFLSGSKAIQEELKMDEKQIKAATEVHAKLQQTLPNPADPQELAKVVADRSKTVTEEIGKILSEDQAKRFRQLMLQYWEREPEFPRAGSLLQTAAAYPGVADAIKLTEEQKKKLIAGNAPKEVLNDTQKSAIKAMLGMEYKGEYQTRVGGPRTPFPQPSAAVRLFMQPNKAADETLKLTDDQVKTLTAARDAYQKSVQAAQPIGGGNINEYIEALGKAIDAFNKAVTDMMTAEQKPRLAQLLVQSDAANNLATTLTAPEMSKKLDLSKDQTDKLAALGQEAEKLQTLRTTHINRAFEPNNALGLKMRDAADERMVAVLTDAQKTKWKELTGDPLPGLIKTIPGRGFGGPGGIGGGGFPGGGGGFIPPG